MKFTINWLKEYVDIKEFTPGQIADRLTMLGLEVDSVEHVYDNLDSVKIARIITAEPHPNADKLQICKVSIGEDSPLLNIVCGAPNAREGLVTAVALPGSVLPGDFKIGKSKIRGVASEGMLCSEQELGLSNASSGIMELSDDLPPGMPFFDAMSMKDTMIEVDLTPNRADCASVIGIAREVAGFAGKPLQLPLENQKISTVTNDFVIDIQNPELCPRYAARLVRNVTIQPSPLWLRNRLSAVGLRPINNVVDVTNYIMMEYGQPLHAFDFATLSGQKIVVRTPLAHEKEFTTLDDRKRKLDDDMLLICDAKNPVAVAGVMGGQNSEVTDTTTTVLLESACFNPVSIRKTARALNLSTDASYRFERGVDPEGTINALNRATRLLCEISGGTCPEGEGIDNYPTKWQEKTINLSVSRCNTLTGLQLNSETMVKLLSSIGLNAERAGSDILKVKSPSFRVDIEREADLVEEVARLYGYDDIPMSLPEAKLSFPEQDPTRLLRQSAENILTEIGYYQAINYSFTAERYLDMLGLGTDDVRRQQIRLLNPLSEDQAVMRTCLLPGLLENIKRNTSFQATGCKLFEIGKIFMPVPGAELPEEHMRLAAVLSGDLYSSHHPLYFKTQKVDIFDIKGAIEYLLAKLRLSAGSAPNQVTLTVPEKREPFLEKGLALSVVFKEKVIGFVGKIRNDVVKAFGIKQDIYYFDVDFDVLCEIAPSPKLFVPLPVYPSVVRDVALLVAEDISAGDLLTSVRGYKEALLEHSEIFDIYTGGKIPKGFKSVALSVTYRSPSKTLTEKQVEKAHTKLVAMLTKKFEAQIREA